MTATSVAVNAGAEPDKKPRIVIFAKAPHPGLVKTRLIPALGAGGAAQFAVKLLHDTVTKALEADIGPVELCLSPLTDPCWQELNLPSGLYYSDQGIGDLGLRMARIADRAIREGEKVILLGTDCPALRESELYVIARALDEHDAVIVPALDGGYVALALGKFDPLVFAGVAWGSSLVLTQTLKRIEALGWRCQICEPLPDIDEQADLQTLPAAWQSWLADLPRQHS